MDTTIIVGAAVVFLAGMTQGLTGFGFSLVFVSIMLVFMPPITVIPIVTVQAALINIIILMGIRKWVDLRRILPLIIAGIAGMPFGVYLLIILKVAVLKIMAGVVIVLFAVAFLGGYEKTVKNERRAFLGVGVLSGLLNGSIGMSGPPVILFFTNQKVNKDVFRGNLVAYFMVLNIVTLAVFTSKGLMTAEVVKASAMMIPAMIAGALAGMRLAGRFDEKTFRMIALVIVILAGVVSIATGIKSI